jgi:valyl-tRNA synthetase
VYSDLEIWMPLPGLVDIQKDIELKKKKLDKLQKELEKIDSKINNQNFIQHAPKHLLEEVQAQHQEVNAQITHLHQRIADLSQMKA